jgi:hypothetical protein
MRRRRRSKKAQQAHLGAVEKCIATFIKSETVEDATGMPVKELFNIFRTW